MTLAVVGVVALVRAQHFIYVSLFFSFSSLKNENFVGDLAKAELYFIDVYNSASFSHYL